MLLVVYTKAEYDEYDEECRGQPHASVGTVNKDK